MEIVYQKEIIITKEHLDKNQHVNNVQYVHWVEEVAAQHWDLLKHKTDFPNDYWVLYDHHLQYRQQVFIGDKLLIKTYPQKPQGIKQPRKVEFYKNNVKVVDSETLWILCDKETHKVKRISEDWLDQLI